MSARKDDNLINPGGEGSEWAAAELGAVGALLDRLAEAERSSAPRGLEERVLVAVREEIAGAAASERAVAALAARERASAGPALEERVFMATRAHLRGRRQPARAEAGTWSLAARVMAPIAAMAAVIAVAGVMWVAVRPAGPQPGPIPSPGGGAVARGDASDSVVQLAALVDQRLGRVLEADWSLPLPEGLEDLSRDMESLSQQVRGELFQFGVLADEEAM